MKGLTIYLTLVVKLQKHCRGKFPFRFSTSSAGSSLQMALIRPEDNFSELDLLHPPSSCDVKVFDIPIVLACEHSLVRTGIARIEGSFASCSCDITPWPLAGWRKLQNGTGLCYRASVCCFMGVCLHMRLLNHILTVVLCA